MKRTKLRKHGKSSRSKLIKKADDLFSLVVRHRDKVCGYGDDTGDPCDGPIQCSHVISKNRIPPLRYDPLNAFAMCKRHHIYGWHSRNPAPYIGWFIRKFPERWDYLEKVSAEYKLTPAKNVPLSYYQEVIAQLETELMKDDTIKVKNSVTELVDFLNM